MSKFTSILVTRVKHHCFGPAHIGDRGVSLCNWSHWPALPICHVLIVVGSLNKPWHPSQLHDPGPECYDSVAENMSDCILYFLSRSPNHGSPAPVYKSPGKTHVLSGNWRVSACEYLCYFLLDAFKALHHVTKMRQYKWSPINKIEILVMFLFLSFIF